MDRTLDVLLQTVGENSTKIDQLRADQSIIRSARLEGMVHPPTIVSGGLQYQSALPTGKMLRLRAVINGSLSAIRASGSGQIDWETYERRVLVTEYQLPPRKGTAKISWGRD